MQVSHILKTKGAEYHTIAPDHPLSDAAHLMTEHRIGALIVMNGERVAGMLSERDITRAVHDYGPNITTVKVEDVMTRDVVYCRHDDSLDEAMSLMIENPTHRGIRHLPVMDGDTLMGIISMRDIVKALLTEIQFENRLLRNYIKNWPEEEAGADRP